MTPSIFASATVLFKCEECEAIFACAIVNTLEGWHPQDPIWYGFCPTCGYEGKIWDSEEGECV